MTKQQKLTTTSDRQTDAYGDTFILSDEGRLELEVLPRCSGVRRVIKTAVCKYP